jgi:BlaI family transcriptional regulator, penicillinase repressor
MDVLISHGRASAGEIQAAIPDPPGYSAVRATLRIMEEKGHIRHEQQGASYVYLPRIAPERAKRSALRHMLDTFFNGSPEQVMAALLDSKPSTDELDRIAEMIEAARSKGR